MGHEQKSAKAFDSYPLHRLFLLITSCFSSHTLSLVFLLYFDVYFTLLGISPLPHGVIRFSLKGPRAQICFAEDDSDDSSQSRNEN